jgi:hypothetical protein
MNFRLLALTALLLIQAPAQAAPFTFSADGQEATDQATGLIWRRCAEGMAWANATCTGTALSFTHEHALLRAKSEAIASANAWRLPSVKELVSLVDRTRTSPAIDVAAFPATPSAWFWSSSPYAGDSYRAWYVYFGLGYVSTYGRNSGDGAVRLVRASQ